MRSVISPIVIALSSFSIQPTSLALRIALKTNTKKISGGSRLALDYWSKGYIKSGEAAPETVRLAYSVAKFRKEFEDKGGKLGCVPALMALVFGAAVSFVCCRNSREESVSGRLDRYPTSLQVRGARPRSSKRPQILFEPLRRWCSSSGLPDSSPAKKRL